MFDLFRWRGILARAGADRRGGLAVITAFALPLLALCVAGTIDISSIMTTKTRLNDATDAAALAVSANTAKNPSLTEAALRTIAQNYLLTNFNANFNAPPPTLSEFHVCAPVQADCTTSSGTTLAMNTVMISATATAPCYLGPFLPGVCTGGNVSMPLNVQTTSTIGVASTVRMYMLLDTSASMIVGSTPADVATISNWVGQNWASIHDPSDTHQVLPCGFACHDEGVFGATTVADIQLGLDRASSAGAMTRYAVMINAATSLINNLQSTTQNAQLSQKTFQFNISYFNDQINTPPANSYVDFNGAKLALSQKMIGINTHLNESLPAYVNYVGQNGTGASANSPLKFLIMVTDGLESDFNKDFYGCTGQTNDPAWSEPYTFTGCFAKTIDTSQCTAIKKNGVVLAVLETPYVPLTGENQYDPTSGPYLSANYKGESLYEFFVRHTIYPNGPNTPSAVSAALQACASPGYYYPATNASDIATGFDTLMNQFVASLSYLHN